MLELETSTEVLSRANWVYVLKSSLKLTTLMKLHCNEQSFRNHACDSISKHGFHFFSSQHVTF